MSEDRVIVRSIVIRARVETVFRFFSDAERFARWFGEGSSIDPSVGGAMLVRYPDGSTASGEVVEVSPNEKIVFTWGYDSPGKPIPPGGSTVEVTFAAVSTGTEVTLRHYDLPSEEAYRAHLPGWAYYWALLANAVAADAHGETAPRYIADFLAAFGESDSGARRALLERATTDDVSFRDRFGACASREELLGYIAAVQIHMPGVTLELDGTPLLSHATAIASWRAVGPSGDAGRGRNVFDLAADGRIERVVGFWD